LVESCRADYALCATALLPSSCCHGTSTSHGLLDKINCCRAAATVAGRADAGAYGHSSHPTAAAEIAAKGGGRYQPATEFEMMVEAAASPKAEPATLWYLAACRRCSPGDVTKPMTLSMSLAGG